MFAQIVRHLQSDHSERSIKKITQEQYLAWEKAYSFEGLKGCPMGQSFCSTFEIVDHILFFNAIDPAGVVKYIKDTYLE